MLNSVRQVGAASFRQQQTRSFGVNPNDVLKRINSTKSIEKITKSMKMVSAAKLRGDQTRLENGKVFGDSFETLFNPKVDEENPVEPFEPTSSLISTLCSDRGLCGGVNTFAVKATKIFIEEQKEAGNEVNAFIMGDKAQTAMVRMYGEEEILLGAVDELTKTPISFAKACAAAQRALELGAEKDNLPIVYNKFVSAIAYDTLCINTPNFPAIVKNSPEGAELPHPLGMYDVEPELGEEALANLMEFGYATRLYGMMLESATSEQSARMNAMENATKNAGEMIDKMTVIYNRARQAKITTELIEIISGAESLKG